MKAKHINLSKFEPVLMGMDDGCPTMTEIRRWASVQDPASVVPLLRMVGTFLLKLSAIQKAIEAVSLELAKRRRDSH